jgi:hypothetical protein
MRIPGFASVAALLLLIQSAATPSARLDELLRQTIAPATLKLASTPAVLNSGGPTPYGFGWVAEFDGKGSLADVWYVASTGDFKGFKGLFKRIPERRFTVIVLANNGELPWKIVALAHELYAGRE